MSDKCKDIFTNVDYCENKACRNEYNSRLSDSGVARLQAYCDQRKEYKQEKLIKKDGTVDTSMPGWEKALIAIAMSAGPIIILKLLGEASPYLTNAFNNSLRTGSKMWAYYFKHEGSKFPEDGIRFFDEFKGYKGLNPAVYGEAIEEELSAVPELMRPIAIFFAQVGDVATVIVHSVYRSAMGLARTILFKLPAYVMAGIGKLGIKAGNSMKSLKNYFSDSGSGSDLWFEPSMGDLGEGIADGMQSLAKGLGKLMGNPLVDAALIGFMVAGAIVDAFDPCNLKSEMDSNALNNIVDNMNSIFQNSLSGNFTSTTLDGAQIIDEVWPIPYFADTYAQSFLDAYGMSGVNNTPCTKNADCASPGSSGEVPGNQSFCQPSGYCSLPWKDSIQRERMILQQLYLNSLNKSSNGNPYYHISQLPHCVTSKGNKGLSDFFTNVANGIGVQLGEGNTYVENWISKWWPLIFFIIAVLLFVLIVLIK